MSSFLQLCNGWTCRVVRTVVPHTKSANTACTKRSWCWAGDVRNMSSWHTWWINSLIKTLRVSCWTAYILQDDTRSLQCQVNWIRYYTGNNWNHRNGTIRFRKKKFGVYYRGKIDLVQQTAVLGTSHITQEVLQSESCRLSGGYHRRFKSESTTKKGPWREKNNNDNNSNNNFTLLQF